MDEEQREKRRKAYEDSKAIAALELDYVVPSEQLESLMNQYIEGQMSGDEVVAILIKG